MLLARNTVVSVGVFAVGLVFLWLLVERAGMAKVPAAALSFLTSNTLHYAFGRGWIYRGTERRLVPGYVYFLMNAGLGLVATVGLFAAFVDFGMHYLLARIVASIFVGLMLFALNATLNFRAL
jgi:putative flippase GtrA